MAKINPLILNELENYVSDTQSPNDIKKLMMDLLELESTVQTKSNYSGIHKLYTLILEKYSDNEDIKNWCNNYE